MPYMQMEYSKCKMSAIFGELTAIRKQLQPGSIISWKNTADFGAMHGAGWYIWTKTTDELELAKRLILKAEQKFLQRKLLVLPMEPTRTKIGTILNKLQEICSKFDNKVNFTWKDADGVWHITSENDEMNQRAKQMILAAEKEWCERRQTPITGKTTLFLPMEWEGNKIGAICNKMPEIRAKFGKTCKVVRVVGEDTCGWNITSNSNEINQNVKQMLLEIEQACATKQPKIPNVVDTVTSYGIILFKRAPSDTIQYLMTLDRFTPDYGQIVRGKYDFENTEYLKTLISRLTAAEIQSIETQRFTDIFVRYWACCVKNPLVAYEREYTCAKRLFPLLLAGTHNTKGELVKFSELVKCRDTNWGEPNWGFPKGRIRSDEEQKMCAVREFGEETGVHQDHYTVLDNAPPITETYIGGNGVQYRHIYFLAQAKSDNVGTSAQKSEVKRIGWYTAARGSKMIRSYHVEKKNMLKELNDFLTASKV